MSEGVNFHAATCDEVVPNLEELIRECEGIDCPVGYFAGLYRLTTLEIVSRAENGEFENNDRMRKMDAIFANRYFDAVNGFFNEKPVSKAWQAAFEGADMKNLSVIQHLFLGMNAHINLDLTVAAAEVAPGESIHDFKKDFDKVNIILEGLFDITEHDIARIWHPLGLFLTLGERVGNLFLAFGMQFARKNAWKHAVELAMASEEEKPELIRKLDEHAAHLAHRIINPGLVLRPIFHLIQKEERGTVAEKIQEFHNSVDELPGLSVSSS